MSRKTQVSFEVLKVLRVANALANDSNLSLEEVTRKLSSELGVSEKTLLGPCREVPFPTMRYGLCFLLRMKFGITLKAIGFRVGNRDHSTIVYGLRVFEEYIEKNKEKVPALQELRKRYYLTQPSKTIDASIHKAYSDLLDKDSGTPPSDSL